MRSRLLDVLLCLFIGGALGWCAVLFVTPDEPAQEPAVIDLEAWT